MTEFNGLWRLGCPNKHQSLTERIFSPLDSSKIDSSFAGCNVDKCFAYVGQQRDIAGLFEHFDVDLSIFREGVNRTDSNGTPELIICSRVRST